jgi:hypothetical protein
MKRKRPAGSLPAARVGRHAEERMGEGQGFMWLSGADSTDLSARRCSHEENVPPLAADKFANQTVCLKFQAGQSRQTSSSPGTAGTTSGLAGRKGGNDARKDEKR